MIADDDDFVHHEISAFVHKNASADCSGFHIPRGYIWRTGAGVAMEVDNFHRMCGTSLIVRANLYRGHGAPEPDHDAINEYGSHVLIFDRLRAEGRPLAPIPFPAAIYRVNHGNASQVDVVRGDISGGRGFLRVMAGRFARRCLNLLRRRRSIRDLAKDFSIAQGASFRNQSEK